MKTSNKIILTAFIMLCIISFSMLLKMKSNIKDSKNNMHQKTIKTLDNLKGFHSINSNSAVDIYISKGVDNVEVNVDSAWLANTKFEIIDSILTINTIAEFDNHYGTINIKLNEIKSIQLKGSGDISMLDSLTTDQLSLKLSGSGSINSNCKAIRISAELLGSGDISNTGTSDEISIQLTGSGTADFKETIANIATVQLIGSGDIICFAKNTLTGQLTGSGNIFYYGSPTITINTVGSGEILQRN